VTGVNRPQTIIAAVAFAVAGVSFFMAMPVVVGAWSMEAGIGAERAGYLATAEGGGGVLASLLVSALIHRINWRVMALLGIVIAVGANLLSTFIDAFYVLGVARSLAGFGCGILYALGLGILAGTRNTGRNFSILLFVQVSYGMFAINLLPYLIDAIGIAGIYFAIATATLGCTALIPWVPRAADALGLSQSLSTDVPQAGSTDADSDPALPNASILPWLCLLAVFLFSLTTSSFWAYIELVGRNGGLAASFLTASLTYTQMVSLLGCVAAGWFSIRYGLARPLLLSLAGSVLATLSLVIEFSPASFVLALSAFFFFWNTADIYQLSTLGLMDKAGQYVALAPAFQMTASALGPGLAGWLLATSGSLSTALVLASACTCGAILIHFYITLRQRVTATG